MVKNAGQVALEMGNSAAIVIKHYFDIVEARVSTGMFGQRKSEVISYRWSRAEAQLADPRAMRHGCPENETSTRRASAVQYCFRANFLTEDFA